MTILNEFKTKARYTLKGFGEPSYYLGGNFGRIQTTLLPGKTSTCFLSARTYIENVCEKIEETFQVKLRSYHAPMSPDYHPEVDETPLLSPENGSRYRMLVDSALWVTTLGTFFMQPRYMLDTMPSLGKVI